MKKVILILILALFSGYLSAQKMTDVNPKLLPKATLDFINQNFPKSNILRAMKMDDKGTVSYTVDVEYVKGRKTTLIFDKDGKFVKKADGKVPDQPKPAQTPAKTDSKAPAEKATDPNQSKK